MKKLLMILIPTGLILGGFSTKPKVEENPFFKEFTTPFGIPPFEKIDNEHFLPAYQEAITQNKAEINAIINNPEPPDFINTIVAFGNAGILMRKVSPVYNGLRGANTNPRLQEIAREITPMLTAHSNDIMLNQELFGRIQAVYNQRETMGLNIEQMRLVEKTYQDFERNGAALPDDKREELKSINERMAMVSLQLNENLLAESNGYKMVIDNEADLAGLPADVIVAATEAARKRGNEGKWVFTLDKPSWIPFLQYSTRRDLREKLYQAYFMRGDNNDKNDNKALFAELMQLRSTYSKLLGFDNYGEYSTDINMARNPQNVYDFLYKLWKPALVMAKNERHQMQNIMNNEGGDFKLASWDWWYYAEKLRKEKYDLDDEDLKPYLTLDNVREGTFMVATRLYGIQFFPLKNVPKYHEEVETYELKEADGTHLGILMIDPHPRQGKRVGAWCGTYRSGAYVDGQKVPPIVTMVMNFTRPSGDKPAMLSWDETSTYFHEFGHALHNFFADGQYRRTSRSVPRDFGELPSQVLENWAGEPEVLKMYAKHYQTGEPMPDKLIAKLQNSSLFNQGFATVEYVAASLLDMDWHTIPAPADVDVNAFEKASMTRIGLIDEILPRYRTTYFGHIFGGGYAAGYYVYLWAGVLDSDAFYAFKESGNLFNPELAAKFRKHILAENSLGEGIEQYVKFRGKEPSIDPLLEKRGLK
ncbi:MAG: M3 family metallopeptidase [Bacteroidales bacterium]|nr:M3 family metallopeptidase [Bacteroidales bacterium]MDZ4204307.1 M3 family metallopeptidase [Bacteroidales bacterium]